MRTLKFVVIGLCAIAAAMGGVLLIFRRNPRLGSSFVNSVVNPALINRRLSGSGKAEIATLEHIGRQTGQRRLTPIHPELTPDGFRILVPLGMHSQWARNVVAAGSCRMQLHDAVFELDEPRIVQPTSLDGLPGVFRRLEEYLGFEYITLRCFSVTPGSLEAVDFARIEDSKEFEVSALKGLSPALATA